MALSPEPQHPQIRFEWTARRARDGDGHTLVFKLCIFRVINLTFLVRLPAVLGEGVRGDGYMRVETDMSQSDPPQRKR